MSHESTPHSNYEWDELSNLAEAGRAFEQHDAAERAKIRVRLDQAIERLQALEREFEEIRDDLEATEQRQTPRP